MQEIISAIDIGTTKICALTAQVSHDGLGKLSLRMLGEGAVPSRGHPSRRGRQRAGSDCGRRRGHREVRAGCRPADAQRLCRHCRQPHRHAQQPGRQPGGSQATASPAHDMQRALEGARAVALPENQEVIHTIARSWTVDGETEVQQPVGMSAYRLEVDAHIVTGSSTAVSNLVQCVVAHGIDVDELVLEPLARQRGGARARRAAHGRGGRRHGRRHLGPGRLHRQRALPHHRSWTWAATT